MACATAAGLLLPTAGFGQTQSQLGKKRVGPRAIGVIRWDADSKDHAVPVLIPVAILEDGKFYDAGLYKAAPAPMPLLVGFVYEAQDEGELLGYFSIKGQTHPQNRNNWIALGDWKSAAPQVEDKFDNRPSSAEIVRDKSSAPTGANPGDSGDDRDLRKKSTTVYDENGKEVKPGDKTDSSAKTDDSSDRPKLKRAPGSSADDKSGKTEPKKPEPDDPDRPTIKRQAKPASTTADTSQSQQDKTASKEAAPADVPQKAEDDPDRPQLKRGKPTGNQPTTTAKKAATSDANVPVMRRGGKAATKADEKQQSVGAPVPPRVLARGPRISDPNKGGTPQLQLRRTYEAVAVSDANVDEPTTFRYKISADEYSAFAAKIDLAAQQQVDTFLKSLGRTRASEPAPPAAKNAKAVGTVKGKSALSNSEPRKSDFAEKQFEVLDLNHRNDPLLVFSGRERTTSSSGAAQDVYVTYVARVDLDGNPRKVFAQTTTSDRLDVTPRLELIDAVDANGDGKGELLFRRVADTGAEFAIYRVTIDGLNELFHGGVAD